MNVAADTTFDPLVSNLKCPGKFPFGAITKFELELFFAAQSWPMKHFIYLIWA